MKEIHAKSISDCKDNCNAVIHVDDLEKEDIIELLFDNYIDNLRRNKVSYLHDVCLEELAEDCYVFNIDLSKRTAINRISISNLMRMQQDSVARVLV